MKFAALTALIATASAAGDWTTCTGASDCSTAGSKCCSASKANQGTVKICAPSATKIVPNGIQTYGGYTVDCSTVVAKNDSAGSNRLVAGAATILGAIYML